MSVLGISRVVPVLFLGVSCFYPAYSFDDTVAPSGLGAGGTTSAPAVTSGNLGGGTGASPVDDESVCTDELVATKFYVHPVTGDDGASGTCLKPFRTVVHALQHTGSLLTADVVTIRPPGKVIRVG